MTESKAVTAWTEVETNPGEKNIVSFDQDCTSAPTTSIVRDRYRICEMDFPGSQKDIRGPFNETIAKAFAAIVLEGLTSGQLRAAQEAAPGLRISGKKQFEGRPSRR